ncbi:MAG: family 78 glycoside hydrolase catalytic domain [Thermoguttaceae bacterium]
MRLSLATVVLTFASLCAAGNAAIASGAVAPVALQCEYLTDPLGIDVTEPRLSWQIKTDDPDARGVRQTGYQLLVAGDEKTLAADRGDLWDSGRVKSDQSTQVAYQGKPLASRTACWWKVRVWDQDGRASGWSQPARWSMGLLKTGDWDAKWIGEPKPDAKVAPWFRKTFTLEGRPARAMAYVASLGYHELYVNGVKADDRVLAPAIADFSQHVRYVTYDVTKHLREGKNVVALWCGSGWAAFPEFKLANKPLVMAQLEIEPTEGQPVRIATGADWKSHPSPITILANWGTQYGGERYDANREVKGWNDAGLDDSDWAAAAVFQPKVRLSAEMVEPTRCIETLKPVEIVARSAGAYRIDLGRNRAGWFEAKLKGRPGSTALIEFSERPNEARSFFQRSVYVFDQTGEGVFRQRFNYSAARWVTISGVTAPPEAKDIRGFLISTDYRPAASFECSDELLNRIYATTLWTFRSVSLGGYTVDCPHRERMGYGGDAHATMETALMNFGMGAFYTKWLGDWRDVQRPDGSLPHTAPTRWGGGGPAWSGICVTLPWQVYLHYGDRRVLEVNYPMMQRWLAFLETKTKNDLLQCFGDEWAFLGDWVPPGTGQGPHERVDDRSTWMFNNCYYADNLATVAKIAALLGKQEDAAAYRKRAEAVAGAAHREFFNAEKNSYANGTQLYEAMPLLMGVTPSELRPAVMKRLEHEIVVAKRGHLDTGIHGTAYLIRCLVDSERNDLVLLMASQKTYPGWGHMLEQGATTFWEDWIGFQSLLHSSFLPIGAWFIEGVAGIRYDPASPGYKHFTIRPGVVGKLTSARGEFESMYGKIKSDWRLDRGWLTLSVVVPPNTTATVYVPTSDPSTVTESGRPIARSPGVQALAPIDGAAVFQVGSGHYTFRARK